MADTILRRLARARALDLRRGVGAQLLEAREERELSLRAVAAASNVDRAVLSGAERGSTDLSLDALASVAAALGREASVRLYPATGPRPRDHVQVRMIETLAAQLDPRWQLRLEVPVWRPARGVIDMLILDSAGRTLVSGEAHGELRRVELQLRRAAEKTDALPSAAGWPWTNPAPRVCRLLLLRNTSALRDLVRSAPGVFGAAYPGRTADAVDALTSGGGKVPDAAIAWVDVRGHESRLMAGPPRGVGVGR